MVRHLIIRGCAIIFCCWMILFTYLQENKSIEAENVDFQDDFESQIANTLPKGRNDTSICDSFINLFTTFIENTTDLRKIAAQEAVLQSLNRLKPYGVQSWLFTKSDFWAKKAEDYKINTVREFETNKYGTPVLGHMFSHVISKTHHQSLHCDQYEQNEKNIVFDGYFNGDIVFSSSLVKSLQIIRKHWNHNLMMKRNEDILVIGKRTNVNFFPYLKLDSDESVLKLSKHGKIFQADALDYFIYSRSTRNWTMIPKFVIGRKAYDNWLVDNAYHNEKTGNQDFAIVFFLNVT